MTDTIVRHPRCQVLLAAGTATADFDTPSQSLGDIGTIFGANATLTEPSIDITSHVTRVRTAKTLEHPNGTFEIGLTFRGLDGFGRRALTQLLTANNAVLISFDRGEPGSTLELVMIGFISRKGWQLQFGRDGSVRRDFVVTGQDAGKFLVRHSLPGVLVTALLWGEGEVVKRLDRGLVLQGPPGQVLRDIFDAVFTQFVPGPKAVRDGVQLTIDPRLLDKDRAFVARQSVWLEQGKFWTMFYNLADKPWNEVFTDYTDLAFDDQGPTTVAPRYAIVVRQFPFDDADWKALPTITVRDSELVSQDLAQSDDERVNFVMVAPNGASRATGSQVNDGFAFQSILADRKSCDDHGFHMLSTSTIYSDLGGDSHRSAEKNRRAANGDSGTFIDGLKNRADQHWRWHSVNDQFYSGSLVIKGRPDVKIGTRAQNQLEPSASFMPTEDDRRIYYVEKVIQDFQEETEHYFTHLAVTRGQPIDASRAIRAKTPERLQLR